MQPKYDDDYPSCAKTFATFRICGDNLVPADVTETLGIEPNSSHVKGQTIQSRSGPPFVACIGGWFLSSEETIVSKNPARHLDWIADQLEGKESVLEQIRSRGHTMDIRCYWRSVQGHGGPTLTPRLMRRLSSLGMDLWFDFY